MFGSKVPTTVARRLYVEALIGSGQTFAIATSLRGNFGFSR